MLAQLRDLPDGTVFRFYLGGHPYKAYGNGWYGWPYSGGPWHTYTNPTVILDP